MPADIAGVFVSFYNGTRTAPLTSKNVTQYLYQRTNYPIMELMKRANRTDMVQIFGTGFVDVLDVSNWRSQNGEYNLSDFVSSPNITENTRQITIPHTYIRSEIGWNNTLAKKNGMDPSRIKSYVKQKQDDGRRKHLELLDKICFRRPDSSLMEGPGSAPRQAISIPAWISEDPVRFLPPATAADGGTVWSATTIAGLAPSADPWRPIVENYDPSLWDDGQLGILAAMDRMQLMVDYKVIPEVGDALQPDSGEAIVIFTNKDGYSRMKTLARDGNDVWNRKDDAGRETPTFSGWDIIHAPQLDEELLEQTVGASAQFTGTPYTDPRFFFVNGKFLAPRFLEGDAFNQLPAAVNGVNQPDTTVAWTQTTTNIACKNRRRSGVVAPTRS